MRKMKNYHVFVVTDEDTHNDGELWSFMRSVLMQGASIWQDRESGFHPTYEAYAARIDVAAAERVDALIKLLAAAPAAPSGVVIPRHVLRWWRELADINPHDLIPRIDAALAAAPEEQ